MKTKEKINKQELLKIIVPEFLKSIIILGILFFIILMTILIVFSTKTECSFNGEIQGNIKYNGTSVTNFELQKIKLENTYCKIPTYLIIMGQE